MFNNHIEGIGQIDLGVEDTLLARQFLIDFGLEEINHETFSTLNESLFTIKKNKETSLLSVTWGLDVEVKKFYDELKDSISFTNRLNENNTIECIDPSGLKIIFQENKKKKLSIKGSDTNTWNNVLRVNNPISSAQKIIPIEIGHIVIETPNVNECVDFYKLLGFVVSDKIVGRGVFLRSKMNSGHHDLFLVESTQFRLNHIAFTVKDVYDLLEGGKLMESKSWNTFFGPGRHNISSAFFWYFKSPFGAMMEYTTDEDFLTGSWIPREIPLQKNLLAKESFISR